MEASSYLQVHEPRKTHELEGHHLLEMANEGARVRVRTEGRKRKGKRRRMGAVSRDLAKKQERNEMGTTDRRW